MILISRHKKNNILNDNYESDYIILTHCMPLIILVKLGEIEMRVKKCG